MEVKRKKEKKRKERKEKGYNARTIGRDDWISFINNKSLSLPPVKKYSSPASDGTVKKGEREREKEERNEKKERDGLARRVFS